MGLENTIVLNEEKKVVYIGDGALKYVTLAGEHPFAYPEGKPEKGDILIYLCKDAEQGKEETQWIKTYHPNIDHTLLSENFLLVFKIKSEDVKPLRKEHLSFHTQTPCILLDTIFERNEILIRTNEDKLVFQINHQTISWDLFDFVSGAILINDAGIKFFQANRRQEGERKTSLYQIFRDGKFTAYKDTERIYGKDMEDILQKPVLETIRGLEPEKDRIYVNHNGKIISIKKDFVSLKDFSLHFYTFEDGTAMMQEISEKSQEYKRLTTGSGRILKTPQFNSFRLWGNEDKIKRVEQLLQKCSVTNTTILLTGESGTGKTFLAREIHKNSKRRAAPFVHVNCAAIPYQLIESELFGYEEGAFTGAKKGGKKGYFEMAYGGTLFLDEITELPITLQGKLLEVLQNKTFYQVGGTKKHEANVRLIAATNKNLKNMVRERRFREDLYYRINVFPIEIPPLRERIGSLYAIITDILPDICSRLEIEPLLISTQALEKMEGYDWPGNIRELENILEKAAILSDGKIILCDDILLPETEEWAHDGVTLREVREKAERDAIVRALYRFHGDKNKAAAYLDMGRTNMFDKVKKYNISIKETGKDDFR